MLRSVVDGMGVEKDGVKGGGEVLSGVVGL